MRNGLPPAEAKRFRYGVVEKSAPRQNSSLDERARIQQRSGPL